MDEILSFIVNNSGRGSAVIFDYLPQSVVNGTCESEAGKAWRKSAIDAGEPWLFGIEPGEIEAFLKKKGFGDIRNVTAEDYKKMYFQGKNANRIINPLHSFAYAKVG